MPEDHTGGPMTHDHNHRTALRTARRRGPLVAFAATIAIVAGACAPNPGGGFDINVGATVPLPPIVLNQGTHLGDLLGCSIDVEFGVSVVGATATIPAINVNPEAGTVSVPVAVSLPAISLQLPTLGTCLGSLGLGGITLPATANVLSTLNLATMQLSINGSAAVTLDLGFWQPVIVIPISMVVQL